MKSLVTAVILNRNGGSDTSRCLEALWKSGTRPDSIVVLDNGSTDGSAEEIQAHLEARFGQGRNEPWIDYEAPSEPGRAVKFGGATFLRIPENLGVAGGRDLGAAWALAKTECRSVFFLDNDARPETTALASLLDVAERASASIVGGLILNPDQTIQFAGQRFLRNIFYLDPLLGRSPARPDREWWDVDCVCGAGFLISRPALETLRAARGEFFRRDLFLYAEDQDLCLQVKRRGGRVVIARGARILHRISRGGTGKATATYYSSRNRWWLGIEHLPILPRLAFRAFYPATRALRALSSLIGRRADVASAHFLGLLDGMRGNMGRKD